MALPQSDRPRDFPQHAVGRWLGDALCLLLLMAICLPIGLSRYRWDLDITDEGLLAYGAQGVMEGQVPHRDFISLQPPLAYYTATATFELLGTSVASLRILGLGIYLGIAALIYAIARQMAGRALSLAAAAPAVMLGIPYFGFVPYSVWQGIAASLAAALVFLRSCEDGRNARRRYWLALSAGSLTAASILFRHDQGLYTAMAILGYVFALGRIGKDRGLSPNLKPILVCWLSGIVLVFLPCLIYWFAVDAVSEMFRQLVAFPITTYVRTSSLEFPRLASDQPFSSNAAICLYYLPPIVVVLAAARLFVRAVRKNFSAKDAKLAFLTLWSALFYLQALTRSDHNHLLITLPPFFILCAWCWSAILDGPADVEKELSGPRPPPSWPKTAASACAAALVAGYLLAIKPVFLADLPQPQEMCPLPRANVLLTRTNSQRLQEVVETVQRLAPPDRSILSLAYDPMLYFVCRRRNPTRWNYLWPGDQTREEHLALIRQARGDPPAVVVITANLDMSSFAPEISEYVRQEYKHSRQIGIWTIYWP